MKKFLLILTMMVAFVFEANAYHWIVNINQYANSMTFVGVVQIDGVELTGTNYEIGAFSGDECRGREMMTAQLVPIFNRYYIMLTVYGNDGDAIDFRVYDHTLGEELNLISSNALTFVTNGTHGNALAPFVFDFVSAVTMHNVAATVDPALSGTVVGTGEYEHGQTCSLTATANSGYAFENWTESGTVVSTNATYSFTVTGDRTLVAHFTNSPANYSIVATANPTAGGTVSGAGTYQQGNTCTLTATANEGYTFENWTENGTVVSTNATYSFTVTGNRALVANFTVTSGGYHWYVNPYTYPNSMTITGVVNIDGVEQATNQLEIGAFCGNECRGRAKLSLLQIFNRYYLSLMIYGNDGDAITFRIYDHSIGQELDLICSNTETFVTNQVTGNPMTPYVFDFVTAIETHNITATAHPAEGGSISGTGSYEHGQTCTLTATASSEYAFENWTENGTVVSTNATYSFTVTGDRALVANFTSQPSNYTINATASPAEGGTISGAGTYQQGTTCTLTATANTGYSFSKWTENDIEVSTNATYSFTVTGNRNLVAHFTETSNEFYWDVDIHAYPNTMTVTGIVLIDGIEQTSTAIELGAFCGDECRGRNKITDRYNVPPFFRCLMMLTIYGNSGDPLSFKLYDHDTQQELDLRCTNVLSFTENGILGNLLTPYEFNFMSTLYYDVTAVASPTEGGTVEGAGRYEENTECTLTAMANEGYHFVNWTQNGNVVSTDATYTFTVTENVDFVARFALNSYEITASVTPEDAGTTEGAGTYNHFSTCQLSAIANEGYHFLNWTLNDEVVSTDAQYIFEVTGPAHLVAHFELNSYEITAAVMPEGTGTVDGTGTYNHFSTCTLKAIPTVGYHFVNWTINNEVVSTEIEYSFMVTAPVSLVAHFEINQYQITVEASPAIGGTANGGGIYTHGSTATLTATSNEHFTFVNWMKDGVEITTDSIYSFIVTEEATYTAYFERITQTQTTQFGAGWTWYSSYIEQEGIDGLGMLASSLGTVGVQIKSQTDNYIYMDLSMYGLPGMWYGELENTGLNNESSYKVQTTASCEVNMTGSAIHPDAHPITINPGWNWIGYPSDVTLSFEAAFANVTPHDGDKVKTQTETMQYNDWGAIALWWGDLDSIRPGNGMMYYSNSSEPFTFIYPEQERSSKVVCHNAPKHTESHWTSNPAAYPDNMTVTLVIELDNLEIRSDEYEIAAFADGVCRGSARLNYVEPLDRYYASLVIAGDEATDLSFGLFDAVSGKELFTASERINYAADTNYGSLKTPFVVHFRSATGVDEFSNLLHVYPNPVDKGQVINLNLPTNGNRAVRVEIIDAMGTVILSESSAALPVSISAPSVPGMYLLRILTTDKDVCHKKLIVR